MNLRKLDMKIERLLRGLAAGGAGPRSLQAGLEIRQFALEALDDRLAEIGHTAGTPFPFNRVDIEFAVADATRRGMVEAAFADRAEFAREVAARIAAGGAPPVPGLAVEVRAIDAEAPACTIRFEKVERQVPRVLLAVLRGSAPRKSYVLRQERVYIGRGEEVADAAGRLLRRNDVVFEGPAGTVSRRHARLSYDWEAAAYFVVDEHSSKGTQVCRGNTVLPVRPGDPRGR